MTSPNYALRKMYFSLLTGISYNGDTVKIYYQQAPDNITDDFYIVYGSINNNDVSSQYKADTETSINITIHSHSLKYNDGQAADDIANEIFSRLYPNKQDTPDMTADGFQLVNTKLTGDRTTPYNILNTRNYLDRILTFTHQIFHLDS